MKTLLLYSGHKRCEQYVRLKSHNNGRSKKHFLEVNCTEVYEIHHQMSVACDEHCMSLVCVHKGQKNFREEFTSTQDDLLLEEDHRDISPDIKSKRLWDAVVRNHPFSR